MNLTPQDSLAILVDCCRHKTGQSYKLRGLLYSLWNGQPYSLLEIVNLDFSLRWALLNVLANFGAPKFFYAEIKTAFVAAGLFEWFIEQYQPTTPQPHTPQ